MGVGEASIIGAWLISGGRCQCRRDHLMHRGHGRCRNTFGRYAGWEARLVNPGLPDTMRNCELLCPECFALAEAGAQVVNSSA